MKTENSNRVREKTHQTDAKREWGVLSLSLIFFYFPSSGQLSGVWNRLAMYTGL